MARFFIFVIPNAKETGTWEEQENTPSGHKSLKKPDLF